MRLLVGVLGCYLRALHSIFTLALLYNRTHITTRIRLDVQPSLDLTNTTVRNGRSSVILLSSRSHRQKGDRNRRIPALNLTYIPSSLAALDSFIHQSVDVQARYARDPVGQPS